MNKVRSFLKEGKCRVLLARLGFAIGAVCIYLFWNGNEQKISNFLKSASVVSVALSVVTYNVRSKFSDYIVKTTEINDTTNIDFSKATNISHIFTNLIFLSFITSILCLIASNITATYWINVILSCTAAGLVLRCSISYIYVMFAFEHYEQKIIKLAKSLADQKIRDKIERERLISNEKYSK